mgnify:CR=1 FL=1
MLIEKGRLIMKKALALLLALLTVCSSLLACGEQQTENTTASDATTDATEPVVTEETPDLPDPASLDIAGDFNPRQRQLRAQRL